jgi:class 3 adenylate cyclase/CHASE2 domain-containing sensor protein
MVGPRHRKLLLHTLLLGLALTLAVILFDSLGWLAALDDWFYDQRALRCQQFAPAPTTQLVHLDIDDRTIDVIGRFPWSRDKLAIILDELGRAKPKAVATDIIFPEPEPLTYEPQPDGSAKPVDHDAMCAAALRRLGCAIVPAALFSGNQVVSPVAIAMLAELQENLELNEQELVARLRKRGLGGVEVAGQVGALFFAVQREAVFARVYALLTTSEHVPASVSTAPSIAQPAAATTAAAAATQPADAVRALLRVPGGDTDYGSPLAQEVRGQFDRVGAINALRRLVPPRPPESARVIRASGSFYAPILPLAAAARSTGFVDFFSDSVVRSVPLLAEHDGRIYPQLGLALALRMLDLEPADVRFTDTAVTIPRKGGESIIIPVRTPTSGGKEAGVPITMDISWFGSRDWRTMYDASGGHRETLQHVPVLKLWDVWELQRRIRTNNANCDVAIQVILDEDPPDAPVKYRLKVDPPKARKYFENRPAPDDVAARLEIAAFCLHELDGLGWLQTYKELEATTGLKPDEAAQYAQLKEAHRSLTLTVDQTQALVREIDQERGELAKLLGGKAVLIGWTATGAAADFVPTPLHAKCPGVVVHGAVFNAIVTKHFWRRVPTWVVYGITLILGLVTAFLAVNLSAPVGLLSSAALLFGYLALNGLVLFGRFDLLLGVAPPVLAIGVVWAMCTLYRIVVETRERNLIKARFGKYVDPMLLDFVLENPGKAAFDGERREMTVVFTDLANFTTLSEELGEKSVALLNDYLGHMVPIIREHDGYLNKFLGDGIMCFYGAPRDKGTHAADAVRTALDMQRAMTVFNEKLAGQGLPALSVRAGVSTGNMVVGDAGTSDASDYTVLGDAVNFGSRLEGANKYLGTRVLVSARTVERSADEFLFRPVGRLRVVGKTEGVDVFEAMCPIERAFDAQKRSAELTREMIEAFKARRFSECQQKIAVMDQHTGGPSKLTAMYQELCTKYLNEPPPPQWDGTVSLTEK